MSPTWSGFRVGGGAVTTDTWMAGWCSLARTTGLFSKDRRRTIRGHLPERGCCPDPRMPLRSEVYAALAEQTYRLPVLPVVVNILPGAAADLDHYESAVLGFRARRDLQVIRLWEWEARRVVDQDIAGLLPLVPVMDGGADPALLTGVLDRLRRTPELAGMEMLLAYMAGLVLDKADVLELMRWNMGAATGLTFYEEILREGVEQGLEHGHREAALQHLQRILRRRFGPAADDLAPLLVERDRATLELLLDEAVDAPNLAAFRAALPGHGAHPNAGGPD